MDRVNPNTLKNAVDQVKGECCGYGRGSGSFAAIKRAEEDFGISHFSITKGLTVERADLDLFREVLAGRVSLSAAYRKVKHCAEPEPTEGETRPHRYSNKTQRGRQVHAKARERMWNAVSTLEGIRIGLQDFLVDRALAGADQEEIKQWDRKLTESITALRDLRSEIRKGSE